MYNWKSPITLLALTALLTACGSDDVKSARANIVATPSSVQLKADSILNYYQEDNRVYRHNGASSIIREEIMGLELRLKNLGTDRLQVTANAIHSQEGSCSTQSYSSANVLRSEMGSWVPVADLGRVRCIYENGVCNYLLLIIEQTRYVQSGNERAVLPNGQRAGNNQTSSVPVVMYRVDQERFAPTHSLEENTELANYYLRAHTLSRGTAMCLEAAANYEPEAMDPGQGETFNNSYTPNYIYNNTWF